MESLPNEAEELYYLLNEIGKEEASHILIGELSTVLRYDNRQLYAKELTNAVIELKCILRNIRYRKMEIINQYKKDEEIEQ